MAAGTEPALTSGPGGGGWRRSSVGRRTQSIAHRGIQLMHAASSNTRNGGARGIRSAGRPRRTATGHSSVYAPPIVRTTQREACTAPPLRSPHCQRPEARSSPQLGPLDVSKLHAGWYQERASCLSGCLTLRMSQSSRSHTEPSHFLVTQRRAMCDGFGDNTACDGVASCAVRALPPLLNRL